MDVLSHHRVQVVSASVKYFLMNEECSFATSLQNILHEKKKLPKVFFNILRHQCCLQGQ